MVEQIDWFVPWPEEALTQVANKLLTISMEGVDNAAEISKRIVLMCGLLHSSVEVASIKYVLMLLWHCGIVGFYYYCCWIFIL